jgi:hypothetical protein
MANTDSFGQSEPTFTEDPLTGSLRSGDQVGVNAVNMGDRFGNPFRFVASGIIANSAGAAVVADLAEGFEYLLVVVASDDANLLVAEDVDSADDLNIIASSELFNNAGAQQQGVPVELLATNAGNTSGAFVSFVAESAAGTEQLANLTAVSTTANDTATLILTANGEVSVQHADGGDSSNGAYQLFWRELPSTGTPRFGNVVSVAP